MMKKFSGFCCMVILCITGSAFSDNHSVDSRSGKLAAIKTVIIDPGHGGLYPGARGLVSTEKNVTLEIALKLGEALQKAYPDIKIVYTRTTDVCSGGATNLRDDLHSRAKIANDSRGDLFISIHCNATPATSRQLLFKTCYWAQKKNRHGRPGQAEKKKNRYGTHL